MPRRKTLQGPSQSLRLRRIGVRDRIGDLLHVATRVPRPCRLFSPQQPSSGAHQVGCERRFGVHSGAPTKAREQRLLGEVVSSLGRTMTKEAQQSGTMQGKEFRGDGIVTGNPSCEESVLV